MRALEGHPVAELAAVVSHHPRTGQPDLDDVLASDAIDALILCTPNLLHAPAARLGLEAGKHVCVEFPLAPGPDPARELFVLAERAERTLHVEHIELLSPSQARLRARAGELGAPLEGEVAFSGDLAGWMADPALSGSPALCALARLHRLLDLFGTARVAGAVLRELAPGHRLEVDLEFAAGGRVRLVETRAPGLGRGTSWAIRCERGRLETPPPEPAAGLFRTDLDRFVARIRIGEPPYVAPSRILEALELVRAIETICQRRRDGAAVP